MKKLKTIIEKNNTKGGRFFDLFIQALIVISLIAFSIDTLPDLSPKLKAALRIAEIVTVTIFTIEYLLRITVADKKTRFIFSFLGIIDLLSILPFYLRLGIDLRVFEQYECSDYFECSSLFAITKRYAVFIKPSL